MADESRRVQDTPEFEAALEKHLGKLRERLPSYIERATSIPAETAGSIEWLGRIGKFWWVARQLKGFSRYEVAGRMGVDIDQVRFLETGLAGSDELSEEFLHKYAKALEQQELYEECRQKFNF